MPGVTDIAASILTYLRRSGSRRTRDAEHGVGASLGPWKGVSGAAANISNDIHTRSLQTQVSGPHSARSRRRHGRVHLRMPARTARIMAQTFRFPLRSRHPLRRRRKAREWAPAQTKASDSQAHPASCLAHCRHADARPQHISNGLSRRILVRAAAPAEGSIPRVYRHGRGRIIRGSPSGTKGEATE